MMEVDRNTKKKKRKRVNENISNWSFGKIRKQLNYKFSVADGKLDISKVDFPRYGQTPILLPLLELFNWM
ncbi:hypothetical protein AWU65_03605 [Paenibacillus glucanolyticus]|jgi:hypothetical protein|uniref:Uncharacterized protein n=1 Tax=Paenibacillus glucanolyticus TaxID=59843 RepID=A0A163GPP5_9BACL|nr:hypothetical protein AWU65_03605 [Paenibacillus glucanolyticus]